jgi:hypothetical protein
MRNRSWGLWLIVILIGLLGGLPDETDLRFLATGGSLAPADSSDDDGEPPQAAEVTAIAAMAPSTPDRARNGRRIAPSIRRADALLSNARAPLTPLSSSLDTTASRQAPLRL